MKEGVYGRLAGVLDALPNRFPPTASGAELRLLEGMFEPEEAELACSLRLEAASARRKCWKAPSLGASAIAYADSGRGSSERIAGIRSSPAWSSPRSGTPSTAARRTGPSRRKRRSGYSG